MKPIVAFPFRHHASLVCEEAKRMLTEAGFELVCNDTGEKLSREKQKEMIADAFGIVAGTETYDADMLSACKNLKVIIRFGVGLDNFDLTRMKEMGVQAGVIANHNSVAEFALMLILSVMKNLPRYDTAVRGGGWNRYPMRELSGKTVGLVGFGRIGRRLAQLMSGFDVKVLVYDPFISAEKLTEMGVEPCAFEALLENSDVVSLHIPLTEATRHIINRETIARMKDGAYLINTARGPLVEESALCEALTCGKLAGAGLDVYESEPVTAENPLFTLNNNVLSPHVSALTLETNYNAGITCSRSIIEVFNGNKPVYPLW